MKRILMLVRILGFAATLAITGNCWAQGGTTVQGGHSGGWYNMGQSGHGVFAEVIDAPASPTGKRMVVAWYAFFQGRQAWILAVGDVHQDVIGQTAYMTAWIYEGNAFPPAYNPNLTNEITWGEISMFFIGCEDAVLEWDSVINGFGSGSLELQRLTTISGTTCDPDLGGIPPLDDHGNSWPTATSFPPRTVYNDFIDGEHESRDDVDAFVFTLQGGQDVAIFTTGPSDTRGTLYRITNNQEIKIDEDDNSGINRNFLIEAELSAGNYSIHVAPTLVGIYGGYRLFLQTNTD
jgi:hypothetical protein